MQRYIKYIDLSRLQKNRIVSDFYIGYCLLDIVYRVIRELPLLSTLYLYEL